MAKQAGSLDGRSIRIKLHIFNYKEQELQYERIVYKQKTFYS